MKKYNTPEMMVSLFENEAVETATTSAPGNAYEEYVNGGANQATVDYTTLSFEF